MNTNNITNRNLLDMHFISAMVLVGLVVIAPLLIFTGTTRFWSTTATRHKQYRYFNSHNNSRI
jgi:hypothetical protein